MAGRSIEEEAFHVVKIIIIMKKEKSEMCKSKNCMGRADVFSKCALMHKRKLLEICISINYKATSLSILNSHTNFMYT